MKAWLVNFAGCPLEENENLLVFAETRGKAKSIGVGELGGDYFEVAAKRWPGMDDLQDTDENRAATGFPSYDPWTDEEEDSE